MFPSTFVIEDGGQALSIRGHAHRALVAAEILGEAASNGPATPTVPTAGQT